MAFDIFMNTEFARLRNQEHLEVKVKKVRKGMDIMFGNRIAKGKGEDGDYQISISWNDRETNTVRRLPGLINELEGMGFEYIPRKRVYRR